MNAAAGAAAAEVPIEDWMHAAFLAPIVNEPWELAAPPIVLGLHTDWQPEKNLPSAATPGCLS